MKVTFFETKGWEKTHLKNKLKDHALTFFADTISNVAISKYKSTEVLAVFINSTVDKKIIESLPKLKLIITMSTGFDHVDVKTAKKRGIPVCSVPFYGENTVAEHALALMLSLSRNIHKAYVRTTREDYAIDGLMGFDLKGKTLGIIGGGHIGMHVSRMAKAFGMKVLVFDLFHDNFKSEIVGFEYASLDEIYRKSDVISLHVPYNEHTHHMINKDVFSKMKKGMLLINTARGGIIDTESLIWALDKKIVAGVGLDVLENEQDVAEEKQLLHDPEQPERYKQLVLNHVLLKRDNVVYTPHIAFYSKEALIRILDTSVGNIFGFLEGKLKNVVK